MMQNKNKYEPYSQEVKDEMIKRMLPPENIEVKKLAIETGISTTSLKSWLKKYTAETIKEKFIPIEVNESDDNNDEENNVLTIKIGSIGIDVKTGFDRKLLTEVLMVVKSL